MLKYAAACPLGWRRRSCLQTVARDRRTIGAGWSSPVARQAHNLKVVGSNPTPATTVTEQPPSESLGAVFVCGCESDQARDISGGLGGSFVGASDGYRVDLRRTCS